MPAKTLLLLLLALSSQAFAEPPLAAVNAWVDGRLAANQASASAYLFLFLGGLLASLLPCVYPLYPITASIIKGRASGAGQARVLYPLTYYAGLATIYFLFGFIAGITGGAINEILRLPFTNLMISLLFLVLALSTAGFIHLPWFSGNAAGENKGGLSGTFLMGMGAGLLSSSCVGPFVVSILIGLASQAQNGFMLAATLVAACKMLAFGLGLGIPFLGIGLFGAKLPRSGAWMKYVQWALGAAILYFAYLYLEKGLSGYHVAPASIQLIFFGALILLFSVYLWQGETLDGCKRMERALYALFAVVGGLIMAQGMLPASSATMAMNPSAATNIVATETKGELTWYLKREDAFKAAREQGKPIFIDFFAYWCANCKEFEKLTQTDPQLIKGLKNAVLLKVYDTDPAFKAFQADSRYPELKVGLPFFAILNADDELLYKTSDYTRTDEMLLFLGG